MICGFCGISFATFFLFIIRMDGDYHHICPGCILKNHPSHFCISCFDVYNQNLSPHARVTCITCRFSRHAWCVSLGASSSKPYRCIRCTDTKFRFFDIKENDDKVDKHLAKQLVTASKIHNVMMCDIVDLARLEAEKAAVDAQEAQIDAEAAREKLVAGKINFTS